MDPNSFVDYNNANSKHVMFLSYHQGLRTLELCVDNLQPDFLYDHIQPVRAELFQVCQQSCFNCGMFVLVVSNKF